MLNTLYKVLHTVVIAENNGARLREMNGSWCFIILICLGRQMEKRNICLYIFLEKSEILLFFSDLHVPLSNSLISVPQIYDKD